VLFYIVAEIIVNDATIVDCEVAACDLFVELQHSAPAFSGPSL
jgi:hypothetical protein